MLLSITCYQVVGLLVAGEIQEMGLWGVLTAFCLMAGFGPSAKAHAPEASTGKIYLAGHWEVANAAPSEPASYLLIPPVLSDSSTLAWTFLQKNARLLGLGPSITLSEDSVQKGDTLESHRFRKTWNGLEVVGGDSVVQIANGNVAFANADTTPLLSLSLPPLVPAQQARAIAFSSYRGMAAKALAPVLEVLLVGSSGQRAPHLSYSVKVMDHDELSSDIHHIDANTGQELLVTSNVQTLVSRRILSGNGTQDDFDVVSDADAEKRIGLEFKTIFTEKDCAAPAPCQQPLDPQTTASAASAWANSGLIYDYFFSAHRRDSIDGNGLPLRSVVNFGGTRFKNAAWFKDRRIMLYGLAGDAKYTDFAAPLDIAAHELTHGITAATSALAYAGESGALNESYSDVFGKLVAYRYGKATDWKMGRDLFRDGTSFVRDMENPPVGNVKDFKYRGEECNRFNDFCGVHENSGIPSRAAVMIAKRIGLDKFAQLYYLTLTQLLRTSSDFKEARAQTEAACATLFGAGADCAAVSEAFEAVGI
ncbi:MAG: M4 family metallopeptidase [Bdellovibrionota bacterium]